LALNIMGHFRFFRNRDDLSIVLDWDVVSIGSGLLGMRDQLQDVVGVVFDGEVEAPVAVDARLPETFHLIKFLGPERRVTPIFTKQIELFVERLSHSGWGESAGLGDRRT
jgi:hypothetical protein